MIFFRRTARGRARRLGLGLIVLVGAVALAACEKFALSDDCASGTTCGGASSGGKTSSSSGGARPVGGSSSGGASSESGGSNEGGDAGAGPVPASGGQSHGSGGAPNKTAPQVLEVWVGDRRIDPDEPLLGVRVTDELVIKFNVPMKKAETQKYYESSSPVFGQADVTFEWDDSDTELRVVPDAEGDYPTVGSADEPVEPITFGFSKEVTSAAGVHLETDYSASFQLLRRRTFGRQLGLHRV
jgi:hypothetical protein